jgi:hypothetical protein
MAGKPSLDNVCIAGAEVDAEDIPCVRKNSEKLLRRLVRQRLLPSDPDTCRSLPSKGGIVEVE